MVKGDTIDKSIEGGEPRFGIYCVDQSVGRVFQNELTSHGTRNFVCGLIGDRYRD